MSFGAVSHATRMTRADASSDDTVEYAAERDEVTCFVELLSAYSSSQRSASRQSSRSSRADNEEEEEELLPPDVMSGEEFLAARKAAEEGLSQQQAELVDEGTVIVLSCRSQDKFILLGLSLGSIEEHEDKLADLSKEQLQQLLR